MTDIASDLREREWVGQYSLPVFGLIVRRGGVVVDADMPPTLNIINEVTEVVVGEILTTRTDIGTYEAILSSLSTSVPGYYLLNWQYVLDGVEQVYVAPIEVGLTSPAYEALGVGFRGIVESVWFRFDDLFDSPMGGPHLQVYFQTHFGRGRLAQLLQVALGRLNTIAQPHQTYSLNEQNPFPFAKWGPLLEQALYVQVIKHLIRSYVEQPAPEGISHARLDRRDYMQRWEAVLAMETDDLSSQLDSFKVAHMGLGRPHVTVSGGIYGNWEPHRLPFHAARPRYYNARF